jgi:putative ABC transport system substrate-binding protein
MRRREFIAGLAGAAAWPLAARAQQGQRERLVCILETVSVDTPSAKLRHPAFLEGLQQLGWTPGRNVRIEARWGEGDEAATRKYAAEFLALTPDVLVAGGGVAVESFVWATSLAWPITCSSPAYFFVLTARNWWIWNGHP